MIVNVNLRNPTVFLLLASVACGVELAAEELTRDEARRLALPLIESQSVDGLSVGVVQGDQQWTFHLGKAGLGDKAPGDRTIYEIGSISKVFTAVLLATSVVDNAIELNDLATASDDDLSLPIFAEHSVRWIDLATHRSGLPRLPDNFGDASQPDPYADYDSRRAREFLRTHSLRRKPGEQFEYSNFAYAWLGYAIAQRSGSDFESLLARRITRPLGMNDTVILLSEEQQLRMATPHASFGKPSNLWDFADLPGAGAIRSTVVDMLKFVAANLKRPEGRLGQAIDLAWQQHHAGDEASFAMGLGWMIARDGQTRFHNGQTGGFHSVVFVNRSSQSAVVVLANTAQGSFVDQLAESLMQRSMGMRVERQ